MPYASVNSSSAYPHLPDKLLSIYTFRKNWEVPAVRAKLRTKRQNKNKRANTSPLVSCMNMLGMFQKFIQGTLNLLGVSCTSSEATKARGKAARGLEKGKKDERGPFPIPLQLCHSLSWVHRSYARPQSGTYL